MSSNVDLLVRDYPRLYHMAEDGSWPSIRQHGLLSTRALLDLFAVKEPRRTRLLRERRPESEQVIHPQYGSAVIRDNKPSSDTKLRSALSGISLGSWYELLNSKVFFWLREARLAALLDARAYRGRPHTVIIVDTARLLAAHGDAITLTPINTGSTAYRAVARGRRTFSSIAAYPYAERRRNRGGDAVVELAVEDGIRDIELHTIKVERRSGSRITPVWP